MGSSENCNSTRSTVSGLSVVLFGINVAQSLSFTLGSLSPSACQEGVSFVSHQPALLSCNICDDSLANSLLNSSSSSESKGKSFFRIFCTVSFIFCYYRFLSSVYCKQNLVIFLSCCTCWSLYYIFLFWGRPQYRSGKAGSERHQSYCHHAG